MKRLVCILLIISAGVFCFGQEIRNPGFELSGKSTPFWDKQEGQDVTISVDSVGTVDGKYCLKISGNSFSWFRQSIPMDKKYTTPTRLRISGFIKSELTKGFTQLFARIVNTSGIAYYNTMNSERIVGSSNWSKYTIDIIVDSTATEIRVGGEVNGHGIVLFDKFSLEPVRVENEQLMATEARSFTDFYLKQLSEKALFKDSVNFTSVVKDVEYLSRHSASVRDCYPVLVYALKRLNDGHSFFMPYDRVRDWESDTEEEGGSIHYATYNLLEDKIGYISIPSFNSNHPKVVQKFADSLQSIIKTLDKNKLKGWIIDLRGNGGGNCWPMIAGIGPLVGNGKHGYFKQKNGDMTPWAYENGAAKEGDTVSVKVNSPYTVNKIKLPIAVLIDGRTASSAEILAITFIGLPNVRVFGQPSYGVTTGNDEVKLPDGSMIFLTSSVYVNRNGFAYGRKIVPDEIVKYSEQKFSLQADPVVKKSKEWIATDR